MNPCFVKLTVLVATCAIFAGCSLFRPQRDVVETEQSQVEQRAYQTRAFDATDKEQTLRAVIATLQDFGFNVDLADLVLGTVSGSKLDRHRMLITVTVRPRGTTQLLVRANAQRHVKAVTDARYYQNFFAALERSMFLKAHEVD